MKCVHGALVLCLASLQISAADRKTGPGSQYPTPADFPAADAVFLLRTTEVETQVDSSSVRVVESFASSRKVFRNASEQAAVEIRLGGGEEITSLSARTILPSGKTVDVRKADIHTDAGDRPPGVIASDETTVRFTFPAVEAGAVLEYSYRKSRPGLYGTDVWEFQREIPVLRTSYTIVLPVLLLRPGEESWVSRSWQYKAYNSTEPVRRETFRLPKIWSDSFSERVGFRWTAENVPAFTPEPLMAPEWYYRAYVRFAPAEWKSWSDLSSWYVKELLAPRLKPAKAVSAAALELTRNAAGEEEKVRALFDLVKRFTYSSVALGAGRIQPRPPAEVLETKWGDCKDKATLLVALLRAVGIGADPVLVRTAEEGRIDPSFPTFLFDHMIVRSKTSDGKVLWLDPTVSVAAAGVLPPSCEGVDVLVLRDDGGASLEKTPLRTAGQNLTAADLETRIEPDGVRYLVRLRLHGGPALRARAEIGDGTGERLAAFCRGLLSARFRGAPVEHPTAGPLDQPEAPLAVAFEIRSDAGREEQADLVLVESDPLDALPPFPSPDVGVRRYPIAYAYPRSVQKSIHVSWAGSGLALRNAPGEVSLAEDVLSFQARPLSVKPDGLELESRFVLRDRFVYVDAWPRLQTFLRGLAARRGERIVFVRKPG
ncbi:MAG TPA: DUF3857 domain-containing protein [Thermoanaerobaculia bacterium]|nr:DUF3857 domain-containing protein [Thermoanaerobaculia bacterium]HQR68279.1 DUF3857 domain-containing protein [Thermoanaerobaculia bacterium]